MNNSSTTKLFNITLLIIAEITAMTLWFVSAAIIGDMNQEVNIPPGTQAALSSAVQGGFVIGAVLSAISGIADRFQPRYVFALSIITAAVCNTLLLVVPIGSVQAILLRGMTGACLAGVYPVGMKIAVGWGQKDRGLLVGLLVGGLTLGSAAPYLLAYQGGADWRLTVMVASALGLLSAFLVMFTRNGPFHVTAAKFSVSSITLAWTDKKVRRAYIGYLGHMWELYAMWAWIGIALAVSFSSQLPSEQATELAKLVAFSVVAVGAVSCAFGGWLADRMGKVELTIIAMIISGASALLFAVTFSGSVTVTIIIALIWGMAIIPDSAQFSALVADYAPTDAVGSLLTFQTALGFALTTLTVQAAPVVASRVGWPVLMALLAIGPVIGIVSMWSLRRNATAH